MATPKLRSSRHTTNDHRPPDLRPVGLVLVNDANIQVIYTDQWKAYALAAEIGGDEHYSNEQGATCQLIFTW